MDLMTIKPDIYMTNVYSLIENLKSGGIFTTGDICVSGDSVGKPGDNFFLLNSINYQESVDRLIFTFGENNEIQIDRPQGIMIEKNHITISQAKKVLWKNEFSQVEYIFSSGKVIASVLAGSKICRINELAPAFAFFSW